MKVVVFLLIVVGLIISNAEWGQEVWMGNYASGHGCHSNALLMGFKLGEVNGECALAPGPSTEMYMKTNCSMMDGKMYYNYFQDSWCWGDPIYTMDIDIYPWCNPESYYDVKGDCNFKIPHSGVAKFEFYNDEACMSGDEMSEVIIATNVCVPLEGQGEMYSVMVNCQYGSAVYRNYTDGACMMMNNKFTMDVGQCVPFENSAVMLSDTCRE